MNKNIDQDITPGGMGMRAITHTAMKELANQYGYPTIMVIDKGQSYACLCAELGAQDVKLKKDK